MRTLVLVALAAGLGALVACGAGAYKSAATPTAGAVDGAPGAMTPRRAELDELDRKITEELGQLGLAPAPIGPEASPVPAADILVPTADPACKPSPSDTCKAQCTLGDSICTNAKRICEIAAELGNDGYANGKCTSGKASCDAARERCCGCV